MLKKRDRKLLVQADILFEKFALALMLFENSEDWIKINKLTHKVGLINNELTR